MRETVSTATVTAGNAEIPALGFGTARMTGDECRRAVETALEVGYRHVDTAQMYDNERAVGEALAASGVGREVERSETSDGASDEVASREDERGESAEKRAGATGSEQREDPGNASGETASERRHVSREDVFVVTKVHPDNAARDDVLESTRESLERLGLETVDLLLLHAPSDRAPLEETLTAMNDLQDEGAVDHVGVSNFSVEQLESARELSETPIVANQVKYHPYHHQDDLLEYCVDRDVCLTAYSPLAEGTVPGDDRLAEIGEPYDKSASQVALRWLVQQPGVAAIPKASSREHIEANADIFDFELSANEMAAVTEVGDGVWNRLAAKLGLH
ncbi:aldo/keto reductase [Haloterrigena salina JCM 13891]|uniref:Aldo/keto reductase n=1 Tax=Haloterrigena salina JCM 13891 TaxID=1227488 RepID=M0C267_9EURY|nr:aldo/keto reductase [Haloterrigena salina]ELZ16763.1 aldo/keto reductase [Haloterrigena salina JCM 13891]